MQSSVAVGNYPLYIEPTSQLLEVKAGPDAANKRPTVLERIPTEEVYRRLDIPKTTMHFFGLHAELDENLILLCYRANGKLTHTLTRRSVDAEWSLTTCPTEITGDPVTHPSVRLVFKTERHRTLFMQNLQHVIEGKVHNPTLALLMDQLAEPLRVIDVWSPVE